MSYLRRKLHSLLPGFVVLAMLVGGVAWNAEANEKALADLIAKMDTPEFKEQLRREARERMAACHARFQPEYCTDYLIRWGNYPSADHQPSPWESWRWPVGVIILWGR